MRLEAVKKGVILDIELAHYARETAVERRDAVAHLAEIAGLRRDADAQLRGQSGELRCEVVVRKDQTEDDLARRALESATLRAISQ